MNRSNPELRWYNRKILHLKQQRTAWMIVSLAEPSTEAEERIAHYNMRISALKQDREAYKLQICLNDCGSVLTK